MAGTNLFSSSPVTNTDFNLVDNGISNSQTFQANGAGGLPLCYYGRFSGTTPPTTANYFCQGCILVQTNATIGVKNIWTNKGSAASPVWAIIDSNGYQVSFPNITATGTSGMLFISPAQGSVNDIEYVAVGSLASSASNYITFSVVNLGQNGTGTTQLLLTNTTSNIDSTVLFPIVANARRQFLLTTTTANLSINQGDILQVTASTVGTLANSISTSYVYINFQ